LPSHEPGPYAARGGPPRSGSAGRTGRGAALNGELGQLGSSTRARDAALRLGGLTSALAAALRGFGLGATAPGAATGSARPAGAWLPRDHAGDARRSAGAKEPLGLKLPPQTGQAILVALIAIAAALLLGVLFSDELRQLFSRLIHRYPS